MFSTVVALHFQIHLSYILIVYSPLRALMTIQYRFLIHFYHHQTISAESRSAVLR